jgi:hypothetical protein
MREHGIEVRPSWMPFTPWTTPGDVVEMLDFVAEHDLGGNVDPIQYTTRLLLPEGSLLLKRHDMRPHLGGYDAERLSYRWTPIDLLGAIEALIGSSRKRSAAFTSSASV